MWITISSVNSTTWS